MKPRILLRAALPALGLALGLKAASAQYGYWERPAPLPPGVIADILREDNAFRAVRRPAFSGRYYIVEGIDRRGAQVRALVSSFTGELIELELLEEPPRRGPPRGVVRLPDSEPAPRGSSARDPSAREPSPRPPPRPSGLPSQAPGSRPATAPAAPPLAETPPARAPEASTEPAPAAPALPAPAPLDDGSGGRLATPALPPAPLE